MAIASERYREIQVCDHLSLLSHFRTPVPVLVEELVRDNDEEGQPERSIPRNASYHM